MLYVDDAHRISFILCSCIAREKCEIYKVKCGFGEALFKVIISLEFFFTFSDLNLT